MKRIYLLLFAIVLTSLSASAQTMIKTGELDECNIKWTFDGRKLTLTNSAKKGAMVEMENFGTKFPAPWTKRKFKIEHVEIGPGIKNIGACAFYGNKTIKTVTFQSNDLKDIAWGAFLGCENLQTIAFPIALKTIGEAAFANCTSLISVKIPNQCQVGDMAFLSCTRLSKIILAPNVVLGERVFSIETKTGNDVSYQLSKADVQDAPANITEENSAYYGIRVKVIPVPDHEDDLISDVDTMIPNNSSRHYNTYALVIGNQDYRYATKVNYAHHDAKIFSQYCEKTLGIPSSNIHLVEDATKFMILEEELKWLSEIPDPEDKMVIVYYAGHGVPDPVTKKAYLLPTDTRGTNPTSGICLDDFYGELGAMNFAQCSVFLDACFSGSSRVGGITAGLRDVEIIEPEIQKDGIQGNMVVFSAATGNQTAQGYDEQGHGLFTYYLLKHLQESSGNIDFGSLADNISNDVAEKALKLRLRKAQDPTVQHSDELNEKNKWRKMRLMYQSR